MTELEVFIALSKILIAEEELDEKLARSYLQRLKDQYPIPIQNLLTAFSEIADNPYILFEVKRRIIDNKDLQGLAVEVIRIWYTSEFVDKDGQPHAGSQDEFYNGLLWKVVKAHAPTNSSLKYGGWQKPPED